MNTARGFTLLELLLSMVVFATIAAIVIPTAGSMLSDRRLTRGTDQLRAELTRLRARAMREGRVFVLQTTQGGNTIEVVTVSHAGDATEAIDQTGSQSSLLSGADQTIGVANTSESPSANRIIELPEGVVVDSVAVMPVGGESSIERGTLLTGAALSASAGVVASGAGGANLQSVYFYPNGQTSNAVLRLSHPEAGAATVRVRGLTGDVTVAEASP